MRSLCLFAGALGLLACSEPTPASPGDPAVIGSATGAAGSAGPVQGGAAPDGAARAVALVAAEHRRAAAEITPADQKSRDVTVRRLAARALARVGGEGARQGLLRALSDEDGEVIGWAAYGLGFSCKGHEDASVAALAARALSLDGRAFVGARIEPLGAIARAIGRCGAAVSEQTLVAWLGGSRERALHASYALGDLVSVKSRLREETLVTLLNVAAGSAAASPLPEALYPLGRQEHLSPTVLERTYEVASARLAEAGDARVFAVRALGRAGGMAAAGLGRVLTTPSVFSASERAEAARALKRLGVIGQRELAQALLLLAPKIDGEAAAGLGGDEVGPLLVALESLSEPGAARKVLRELAGWAPPTDASPLISRRLSWVRCAAAAVVAGADVRDPLLTACDVTSAGAPEKPRGDSGAQAAAGPVAAIGARAVIRVLDRGPITGARLSVWRAYAEGEDRRARQAALELIASHTEIAGAADTLAKALGSTEEGIAAVAAEVITKQPQRAIETERPQRGKKRRGAREAAANGGRRAGDDAAAMVPSTAVTGALTAALERAATSNQIELIDALIDAAGALGLQEAAPTLQLLCRSAYPTTRGRAEKALTSLGGKGVSCAAPASSDAPPELGTLARTGVTLALETDVGEATLSLDPSIAPVAVTRIVELSRAGFYDGMMVHRVVPGFVTQFGAPLGDGYGGPADRLPLRCETSPLPFGPLQVGVALSGRDTGSSQIFVMHAHAPHLEGQYAWIGSATGAWSSFVDGDRILKVSVRE
ncbi:peptidylprolyl isomerase [Chondromyces crocatus]|uniref:peptidylprolyl isomerase n=1 Tax=Chondromyces crocatus TaxID=52 RepID=A0A0K1EAQ8_CHOCO|nr:peptidylprolyl isomerase [Chondromyces crocatus]AKT37762.1 uncharacterized protein CMC5_019040 [Chondromyces crocatus]